MHVLVTGATGFIGSHVVRALLGAGAEVTALVRSTSNFHALEDVRAKLSLLEGDVLAPDALAPALAKRPPDIAIHLAWCFNAPQGGVRTHDLPLNADFVAGSMRLLSILHDAGCKRTVMSGTCIELDTEYGYLSETTPARPRNLYAASKHALFLMAEAFQKSKGRSFAWARLFNTYGPFEYEGPLVGHIIRRLLAGEACQLTSGTQIRDYSHVEDMASAIVSIARSEVDGAVNVGSSRPVRIAEIAETIGRLTGRSDLLQIGALPSRSNEWTFCCANTLKLQTTTGWKPRFGLEDGLAHTIEWYRRK